jgi:hypothetical protein
MEKKQRHNSQLLALRRRPRDVSEESVTATLDYWSRAHADLVGAEAAER